MGKKENDDQDRKKRFLKILEDKEEHLDRFISSEKTDPIGLLELQLKIAEELMAIERKLEGVKILQITKEEKAALKEAYQYDLKTFRILGDALAWMFVKPYSIRQHVKHSPFSKYLISQKRAFDSTVSSARHISEKYGEHVLINDLTNCLRIADLSVCRPGECRLIEVKSIENEEELTEKFIRHAERQIKRMEGFDKLHGDAAALEGDELRKT